MDLPLLDSLTDPETILLDPKPSSSADPFSPAVYNDPAPYIFLPNDPFAPEPDQPADAQAPLAVDTSLTTDPELPSKSELVLDPFQADCSLQTLPSQPSHPPRPPASPGSENVPSNTQRRGAVRKRAKKKTKALKKEPTSPVPSSPPAQMTESKQKDKLAQRKLRNKESARRYREKQVARRRQLEQYTRTLTEQNRELENLHDRLLALTCERQMRGLPEEEQAPDTLPPNVL